VINFASDFFSENKSRGERRLSELNKGGGGKHGDYLSRRRTVEKKEHSTNLYVTRQLVRDKDRGIPPQCLEETNKKMIEVVRLMS